MMYRVSVHHSHFPAGRPVALRQAGLWTMYRAGRGRRWHLIEIVDDVPNDSIRSGQSVMATAVSRGLNATRIRSFEAQRRESKPSASTSSRSAGSKLMVMW